jgi:hypothetical protein
MVSKDDLIFPDAFNSGLTKRELFAVMAMQGLLSNPEVRYNNLSRDSVEIAYSLIEELNK